MAKKKTTDAVPEEPAVKTPDHDPQTELGLDFNRDGTYVYVSIAPDPPHEREIVRDGVRFHHCADDVDGCWLYRRSAF